MKRLPNAILAIVAAWALIATGLKANAQSASTLTFTPATIRVTGQEVSKPRALPSVHSTSSPVEIPSIPDAAKSLLPSGCVQAWDSPAFVNGGPPSWFTQDSRLAAALTSSPVDGSSSAARGGDLLLESTPVNSEIDPLSGLGPDPDRAPKASLLAPGSDPMINGTSKAGKTPEPEDPHRAMFFENAYPSALTCAKCHPQHYEEWRVSSHAYATISPMFQRFEQTLVELSQGTVGSFCYRCHGPIATQESYPRTASVLDAPSIVREGITCIACHRVIETYTKTHGHRRVEPGSIFAPVYGGGDGSGVAEAVRDREKLKIKVDPSDTGPGQPMHTAAYRFDTLTRSDFCLTCHQVAVHPGIWLEVVYAQYNAGPAKEKGITCQDCHMGAIPGKPNGYECLPVAEIAGKSFGVPKKHSNHMFWGPGYPITHPGVFPLSEKGERWSPREWLRFDWQAGWGTDEFERAISAVQSSSTFPQPWDNGDERRDARKIIDTNLKSIAIERAGSITAMENGSALQGPFMDNFGGVGQAVSFHYILHNASEGHNFPTGSLGAQPQVWLNVALVNPAGQTVWESGYLDTQGDLADLQSVDVAKGIVPRDAQLFNLQTKFLINNIKGTDRELPLPVNIDIDQIPFLRPGAVPVSVLNHPPFIRMEAHSIPPLDHRKAKYRVPGDRISIPGTYRLDVRLRSRVEPTYFMRFVGCTPDLINRMNHQILDIHPQSFYFNVP